MPAMVLASECGVSHPQPLSGLVLTRSPFVPRGRPGCSLCLVSFITSMCRSISTFTPMTRSQGDDRLGCSMCVLAMEGEPMLCFHDHREGIGVSEVISSKGSPPHNSRGQTAGAAVWSHSLEPFIERKTFKGTTLPASSGHLARTHGRAWHHDMCEQKWVSCILHQIVSCLLS